MCHYATVMLTLAAVEAPCSSPLTEAFGRLPQASEKVLAAAAQFPSKRTWMLLGKANFFQFIQKRT
jgi:hypothetical protein